MAALRRNLEGMEARIKRIEEHLGLAPMEQDTEGSFDSNYEEPSESYQDEPETLVPGRKALKKK